ncbi:MAG: hypothetical protein LBT30_01530, partial [Clostridiales bacterium]|nr:hypothetical protein [Clostridiales bacterium]
MVGDKNQEASAKPGTLAVKAFLKKASAIKVVLLAVILFAVILTSAVSLSINPGKVGGVIDKPESETAYAAAATITINVSVEPRGILTLHYPKAIDFSQMTIWATDYYLSDTICSLTIRGSDDSTHTGTIKLMSGYTLGIEGHVADSTVVLKALTYNGADYTSSADVGAQVTVSTSPTTLALNLTTVANIPPRKVYQEITTSAIGNGTILPALNGLVALLVEYGTNQTFTFTPSSGHRISTVFVDGVNNTAAVSSGSYTFINVIKDHNITVTFVAKTYNIDSSIGSGGLGGTISPSGTTTVAHGGSQKYTIVASDGYQINFVTVDGAAQGAISTYTFSNVTADHAIIVSFLKVNIVYYIEASVGAGSGTISPSGLTRVSSGGSQSYTITPSSGYEIDYVLVDGANKGAVSTYTFSNVVDHHTIVAYFKLKIIVIPTFTITPSSTYGGGIYPSAVETIVSGGNSSTYYISYLLTNYTFDYFLIDNSTKSYSTTYQFTNVTANHTIEAYFKVIPTYSITASVGSGSSTGSISPSGTEYVTQGSNSSIYRAYAGTDYAFNYFIIDNSSYSYSSSYQFTNVQTSHTIVACFTYSPPPPTYYYITASVESGSGSI